MRIPSLAMYVLVVFASATHAHFTPQKEMTKAKPEFSNVEQTAAKPPFTGRLPRYFSKVVSPEQRETIYEIQHGFRAQIEKLQQELELLKKEQMEAVEAVLSEAQLAQVHDLRGQASSVTRSPATRKPTSGKQAVNLKTNSKPVESQAK